MTPMPEPRDVDSLPLEQAHHAPRLSITRPMPFAANMPNAEQESAFEPRRMLNALRFHWFLLLFLGTILGGSLGFAAWQLFPAKYTTTALLRVNSNNVGLLGPDPTTARNEFLTFLRTQADAIRSENVLRAALRDSKIGNTDTLRGQDDKVRWLQENILVDFSEHSELMKVSMTNESAPESAEIINAVNAAYIKEVVMVDQLKKKAVLDTLNASRKNMEEQVKNLKVALDLKRKKPAHAGDAATPPDSQPLRVRVGAAEFARMNDDYRKAEIAVKVAEQNVQTLKTLRDKVDATLVTDQELEDALARDTEYKAMTDRVERLTKHHKFLSNSYSSRNHPDVADAARKVKEAKIEAEDFKRTRKTELTRQVQVGNRRKFDAQIDNADAELRNRILIRNTLHAQIESTPPPKETNSSMALNPNSPQKDKSPADYDLDESGLVYAINTYEDLLKRQNQQSVETQASRPRVDEWQKASVPIKKEMKKQIVFTAFATLFGFLLVAGGIVLFESRANRLHSTRDLDGNLAVSLLGTLPEIGASDAISAGDATRLRADPFMEGVEQLRMTLLRSLPKGRSSAVAISSAAAGEGKSTLAGHLAVSLTRADRKTLLIDANLRQPGLHDHLGLPSGPGVCEILRSEIAVQDVVQRTGIANLWFLPAGAWDSLAQQGLGRDRFRRVLDKLRQEYDAIIIDSHDLLTVADTAQISQHCDAVIMCARKYVSRKPAVEQACRKLAELGVATTGLVFMGEAAK